MKGRWTRFGVAVTALAMASVTLTPLAQAQGDTIKIVSSLPRTGSSKGQTDTIVNAIKMALDEAGNKAGGFTITYEDMDDATPARGAWDAGKEAENANKAVADADVMVYIGTFNSGAAKVAIPILNRSNLVMISPANTYPGLTKPGKGEPNEPDIYYPNGKRNYARVVPADDLQGAVAANWAKQLGVEKVYVLDDTELYGHGIAQVFADTAKKIGLERRWAAPRASTPRRPTTGRWRRRSGAPAPDMVYYGGITQNNAGKLFKDLRAVLGDNVKLMGPDGIYEQAFIDDAGDAAEGVYITFGGVGAEQADRQGRGLVQGLQGEVQRRARGLRVVRLRGGEGRARRDQRGPARRTARRSARPSSRPRTTTASLGNWSFDANGDTTLTTMSGRQVVDGKFDEENAVVLRRNRTSSLESQWLLALHKEAGTGEHRCRPLLRAGERKPYPS